MTASPAIGVVIPVFNHALTVRRVVRGAKEHFPVIVVNDGSTDRAAGILAAETGIHVVALPRNQGKGAALRAGFAAAQKFGLTHAITIDADGQHDAAEIPAFAAAVQAHPDALIIGARSLVECRMPPARRIANRLSTFAFKLATGIALPDAQCGYRAYPLAAVERLGAQSDRYAYELEVLIKAAQAGMALRAQPVSADYAAPTSRLSHFRPCRDFAHLSLLHLRFAARAFFLPPALRRMKMRWTPSRAAA